MKISFTKKKSSDDHLVYIIFDHKSFLKSQEIQMDKKGLIDKFLKHEKQKKGTLYQTFFQSSGNGLTSFTIVVSEKVSKDLQYEVLGANILSYLESKQIKNVFMLIDESDLKNSQKIYNNILSGIILKDYRFEKYKKTSKKDNKVNSIKIANSLKSQTKKNLLNHIDSQKGNFLTRNLVSEPANILYPSKFVDLCSVLKKEGVKIEVLDEKKMKSLGMNALLGVSQGSVKPARLMVFKWLGNPNSKTPPISFIGKGVTFDTGGISIKPSGGMEDMKWDMGGAGVVAGLMYTLALRKSKSNVIGAVGLVENMPDGNAQRPGDVVESMSGQTIEVLNTDAEGRLVLADVLWYIKQRFKPKLMIDLATLTGAIIVALGDRYAGLFSNDDKLASKILESSSRTNELVWRLPMDEKFDKLLNCKIADMKNITGTRGAGSITAAQFLKRFVGETSWAHLDIAGVTWSNKGTDFSRPGGTGFGVRLLDDFVKNNYE